VAKQRKLRTKLSKKFEKKGVKYAFLELKPVTGRTHQLRVHMSYIKHPIVGDHVYGQGGATCTCMQHR
jgi:23S rRNA-/tRNA-specific pseudouridylate synthase